MQPNQPPPAPPPVNNNSDKPSNPYDFLSAKPQPTKGTLLPTNNTTLQRVLIVLGIVAFLIIGLIVVMSILGSAGKQDTTNLITVAKQQTELIRVADIGVTKAKLNPTQNLALTTKLSLQSDQPALLAAIKAAGTKVNPKDLATGNATTDSLLNKAEQDNKFDAVFMQVITQELADYQASLKKAYQSAVSKKLKDSISIDYEHINLIVGKEAL